MCGNSDPGRDAAKSQIQFAAEDRKIIKECHMSLRNLLPSLGLFAIFIGVTAQAAVPPLSEATRREIATHIVTGHVTSVKSEVVQIGPGMTNAVFTVKMIVDVVEKGTSLQQGQMIAFQFWKVRARPHGWAGPQGQNGMIQTNTAIRAFLKQDPHSAENFTLLVPNGFDKLQ